MKKSNFIALVLGTVSCSVFGLGMCMVLISEWELYQTGIILGCAGGLSGLLTFLLWRKMEKKPRLHLSLKSVLVTIVSITGTLLFGVGLCMIMVWEMFTPGCVIGLAGILIDLCLIPLTVGLK